MMIIKKILSLKLYLSCLIQYYLIFNNLILYSLLKTSKHSHTVLQIFLKFSDIF